MAKNVIYNGTEFKCIDRIPEYADYHSIYVAKEAQVDEHGREYHCIKTDWGKDKVIHPLAENVKPNGYLQINLPSIGDGIQHKAHVHRLVYLTWCDSLPRNYQELQVNHMDERKCNNNYDNLELVTAKENVCYGTARQRAHATKVRKGATIKIVAINIQTKEARFFDDTNSCAKQLGLNQGNVYNCICGRQRSQKGYVFCRQEEYSPAKVETMIKRANHRVVAFDTNAIQEYHFATIRECARVLDLDERAIYRCLAGQQRQHKGFVFCREDGIINN